MAVELAKNSRRDRTRPAGSGPVVQAGFRRGYDKKTQGEDVAGVLDALKITKADLVTHDIGNMVGYAFAAEHRDRVGRFVLIDAPLPGASGRGRRFSRTLCCGTSASAAPTWSAWSPAASASISTASGTSSRPPPPASPRLRGQHYAKLYALPGAMHGGFSQFAAFDQDAIDNKAFVAQGKLTMPGAGPGR
ncbi:alpha/beta fold hydrolase [Caulobacter segnis]